MAAEPMDQKEADKLAKEVSERIKEAKAKAKGLAALKSDFTKAMAEAADAPEDD